MDRKPPEQPNGTEPLVVRETDVLFECPRCGKSMVIEERAVGLIVDCPDCHADVMVPPKHASQSELAPDLAALTAQIAESDVLFECPECGKSMVIDDSAVGAYVECPRCQVYVVVPPKPANSDADTGEPHSDESIVNAPTQPTG